MLKVVLVGPTKSQFEFGYKELLEKTSVIHYPSADEALLNLSDDAPDVILVDVDSSRVNATRLCNTIKENKKFSDIPIILTSGGSSMEDSSLYFKGVDFIKKPFSPTELLAKLNIHKTLRDMCSALKSYKGA